MTPDLGRQQVQPDPADPPLGNSQLIARQRRGECIGQLDEPAARSEAIEARPDDGILLACGEPFDQQARNDGAKLLGANSRMLVDSRRIALKDRDRRKLSAQNRDEARLAFERDDTLRLVAGA